MFALATAILLGTLVDAFHTKDLYGNSKQSAALRQKVINKSTFLGTDGQQHRDLWSNNYGQTQDTITDTSYQQELDFKPSGYALSYHRCAAVQQFSDDMAAQEDSNGVLSTKQFAIFRFCPAATCDGGDVQSIWADYGTYTSKYGDSAEDGGDDEQTFDGGARAKGCSADYGEYMIELSTYLQIMSENTSEQAESYCSYCEKQFYETYKECVNNGGCRRDLKYEDYVVENQRELSNICKSENDSGGYGDICNGALDDITSITDYFECTEAGNGGVYLGPHCMEDGMTVTLGVYTDEYCSEYIGGDVTAYLDNVYYNDNIGLYVNSPYGKYISMNSMYNSKYGAMTNLFDGGEESYCMSCEAVEDEDDWESKINDANNQEQMSQAAEYYYENIAQGQDEMSGICTAVYESSAHCHKNFANFQRGSMTAVEWKQMQLSCDFIDSVSSDTYDEMGYVNLKDTWDVTSEDNPQWLRDSKYAQDHIDVITNVSPLQALSLAFSILACVLLAVWAKTLQRSLSKKQPWAPKQRWNLKNILKRKHPLEIDPSDSGIGASRVRSDATTGTKYYMS